MCPASGGELRGKKKCKVARSEALTNPGCTTPSSGGHQGSPTPLLRIRCADPATDPVHVGDFKSGVPVSLFFCGVSPCPTAPAATPRETDPSRADPKSHAAAAAAAATLFPCASPQPHSAGLCGAVRRVEEGKTVRQAALELSIPAAERRQESPRLSHTERYTPGFRR